MFSKTLYEEAIPLCNALCQPPILKLSFLTAPRRQQEGMASLK
jgi:hypothetical protein